MWLTKVKNSPFWHARWDHPNGSGEVVSRTTKSKIEREAERRGRELEEQFKKEWEKTQAGGAVSSKHVIDEFWETEASKRKASETHAFPHLNRIDAFLKDRAYCDVTIADVARFADAMEKTGQFSPSTINRALSIWRRMHNVAAKTRLYPVRIIDWSQVWRQEPEPKDAKLTPEKLRTIFVGLTPRGREIAMFALLTGCRKAQVLGLEWDRVDLNDGIAQVYRKHRKSFALFTIELNEAAMRLIVKRHEVTNGIGLVFDTTNFRLEWETAVKAAGLKGDVRFHDLRHAFATMAAKRTPIIVLKELLGHSTINTTMRYAHVQRADRRAAVSALPDLEMLVAPTTDTSVQECTEDVQVTVQVDEDDSSGS